MSNMTVEVKEGVRVFGFEVAQELSAEEMEMISGAAMAKTSYTSPCATPDDCAP